MPNGYGLYPMGWEYRPRFMWDVGASEQDIINVLEGMGGRGGYGTIGPPAMGWYGSAPCPADMSPEECAKVQSGTQQATVGAVLGTVVLCAGILGILGVGFYIMGKQMDKLEKGESRYEADYPLKPRHRRPDDDEDEFDDDDDDWRGD